MIIESTERSYQIQVRQRGQVTLPRKLRDALAIDEGDVLTILPIGETLMLIPRPLRTAQLADELAEMVEATDLSLADLLDELPRIRESLFEERYRTDSVD